MAPHNLVLSQFLKLAPRCEFAALENLRYEGRKLRKMARCPQFVAAALVQLAGWTNLASASTTAKGNRTRLSAVASPGTEHFFRSGTFIPSRCLRPCE